jgi:hypothetical protein
MYGRTNPLELGNKIAQGNMEMEADLEAHRQSVRRRVSLIQQQKESQLEAMAALAGQSVEAVRGGQIRPMGLGGGSATFYGGAGTGNEDMIRSLLSQQRGGGGMPR